MLLRISTARVTLADHQMNIGFRQTKDGESRDKVSTGAGKKSGRAP